MYRERERERVGVRKWLRIEFARPRTRAVAKATHGSRFLVLGSFVSN